MDIVMASRISPNPNCWDLRISYSPSHSHWENLVIGHGFFNALPCHLVYRSPFSRSSNLRVKRGNHSCSAHFDDFHIEERMNLVKGSVFYDKNTENSQLKNVSDRGSSEKFCTMKPELLEPSLLGIQPEPPTWPERDEILRLSFERKVNSVGIPLSIRMIKKKLQLQEDVNETCELTYSSVKKTFSSMMFVIHEIQNHALQTRESLCCEDLQSVKAKLRRDIDASFVWLFQQVFSKTPTLMVDLMVLLANFSVFSMNNNNTPSSMITNGLSFINNDSKQKRLQVDAEVDDQDEYVKKDLTEEEEVLWNSVLEEASILQKELRNEVLDHETMQSFVSPVSVELEGDQYEEYVKTDLYYKMHLLRTPQNSLLLSNYAQFLFLVLHDIDGAEEYYKRSVLVESPEAEAFSRYADFLWQVRKDVWAAELRYLQAMEADPGNTYCLSKYASFIWNTGGTDNNASFPIEELDNLQL